MKKHTDLVINHFGDNEIVTRFEFYEFVNRDYQLVFHEKYGEILERTNNFKVKALFTGTENEIKDQMCEYLFLEGLNSGRVAIAQREV